MRPKMLRTLFILRCCSAVIWASPTSPVFERPAASNTPRRQEYENYKTPLSPVPKDSLATSTNSPWLLNYNTEDFKASKSQIDKRNTRQGPSYFSLPLHIPEREASLTSNQFTLPIDAHPIWHKLQLPQKPEPAEPFISSDSLTSTSHLPQIPYAPYYQPSWETSNPWDRILYYRRYGFHGNHNCPPYLMTNNYYNQPGSNFEDLDNPGYGYYGSVPYSNNFEPLSYYGTSSYQTGLQSSSNYQHAGFTNNYQPEEPTAASSSQPYMGWPQENSHQSVSPTSKSGSIPIFGNPLYHHTNERQYFNPHLHQPTNVNYGSSQVGYEMISNIKGQNPSNSPAGQATSSILEEKNITETENVLTSSHISQDVQPSTVASTIHHYTQTTQLVGGVEQASSFFKPQETSGSQYLTTGSNFQPSIETQTLNSHSLASISTAHNAAETQGSQENQIVGMGGMADGQYQLQGQHGMHFTPNKVSQQTLESTSSHAHHQMSSSENYGNTPASVIEELQVIHTEPQMHSITDQSLSFNEKHSHSAASTIITDTVQSQEIKPQIMAETSLLTNNAEPHDRPQPGILSTETGSVGIQQGTVTIENIESHQESIGIQQSYSPNSIISTSNSASPITEQQGGTSGALIVSGDTSKHSESANSMFNNVKPESYEFQPEEHNLTDVNVANTGSIQSNQMVDSNLEQLSSSTLHQSGNITPEQGTVGAISETTITATQGYVTKDPEPISTPDHFNLPHHSSNVKPELIAESFTVDQSQALLAKPSPATHHGENILAQPSHLTTSNKEHESGKLSVITSSGSTTFNYTSSETKNSTLKESEGLAHNAEQNFTVASTHLNVSHVQQPQKMNSSLNLTATDLEHLQITQGTLPVVLHGRLPSPQNLTTLNTSAEHSETSSVTSNQEKVSIAAVRPDANPYVEQFSSQIIGTTSNASATIDTSNTVTVGQISLTSTGASASHSASSKINESIYQLHPNLASEASVAVGSIYGTLPAEKITVTPVISSSNLGVAVRPEHHPIMKENQQSVMHSQIDGSVNITQERIPTTSLGAVEQHTSSQKVTGNENVSVLGVLENTHFILPGKEPNLSVNKPVLSFSSTKEHTIITQQSLTKPHLSGGHNNYEHQIAVGASTDEQVLASSASELIESDRNKRPISTENQLLASHHQPNSIHRPADITLQHGESLHETQNEINTLTSMPPHNHEGSYNSQHQSSNIMAESVHGSSTIKLPNTVLQKPANQVLPSTDGIDILSVNSSLMNSSTHYVSYNQSQNAQQTVAGINTQPGFQSNSEREEFQAIQYAQQPSVMITHSQGTSEEIHSHLKPPLDSNQGSGWTLPTSFNAENLEQTQVLESHTVSESSGSSLDARNTTEQSYIAISSSVSTQNKTSQNNIASNFDSTVKSQLQEVAHATLTIPSIEFSPSPSQHTSSSLSHDSQQIISSAGTETSIHVSSNAGIDSTSYTSNRNSQNATLAFGTKNGANSSTSSSESPSNATIDLVIPSVPALSSSTGFLNSEHVDYHAQGNGDSVKPFPGLNANSQLGSAAGSNVVQGEQNPTIFNKPIGIQSNFEVSSEISKPEATKIVTHSIAPEHMPLIPSRPVNGISQFTGILQVSTTGNLLANSQTMEGADKFLVSTSTTVEAQTVGDHSQESSHFSSTTSLPEKLRPTNTLSAIPVTSSQQLTGTLGVAHAENIQINMHEIVSSIPSEQKVNMQSSINNGSHHSVSGILHPKPLGQINVELVSSGSHSGSTTEQNLNYGATQISQAGIKATDHSSSHHSIQNPVAIDSASDIHSIQQATVPNSNFIFSHSTVQQVETSHEISSTTSAFGSSATQLEATQRPSVFGSTEVNVHSSVETVTHNFVNGPTVSEQTNAGFVASGSKEDKHIDKLAGSAVSTGFEILTHSTVHARPGSNISEIEILQEKQQSNVTSGTIVLPTPSGRPIDSHLHLMENRNSSKLALAVSNNNTMDNPTIDIYHQDLSSDKTTTAQTSAQSNAHTASIHAPSSAKQNVNEHLTVGTASHHYVAGYHSPSTTEQNHSEFLSSGSKIGFNGNAGQNLGINELQITQSSVQTSSQSTVQANSNSNVGEFGVVHMEQQLTPGSIMHLIPKPEMNEVLSSDNKNTSLHILNSSAGTVAEHVHLAGDNIASLQNLALGNVPASTNLSGINRPQDIAHSSVQSSQFSQVSLGSPSIILPIDIRRPASAKPAQIQVVLHGDATSSAGQGNLHNLTGDFHEHSFQNNTETISGTVQNTQNTILTMQKGKEDLHTMSTPLEANTASILSNQSGSQGIQKGTEKETLIETHSSQITSQENLSGAIHTISGHVNQPILSVTPQPIPEQGKPIIGMPISLSTTSDLSHFHVSEFEYHKFNRIPTENLIMISAEYFISLLQQNKCDSLKQLIPILQRPMSGIILLNNNNVH